MELSEIYDNEDYNLCLLKSLIKLKDNWKNHENILYIIKSLISIEGFKVHSISQCKILIFYYFYTLWRVEFEWWYTFIIDNTKYHIWLNDIINDNVSFDKFKSICDFWKNKHFLADIDDNIGINNYILMFIKQNSELYAFSWDNFPLFKWIINEVVE
jgi:hypothetical protein